MFGVGFGVEMGLGSAVAAAAAAASVVVWLKGGSWTEESGPIGPSMASRSKMCETTAIMIKAGMALLLEVCHVTMVGERRKNGGEKKTKMLDMLKNLDHAMCRSRCHLGSKLMLLCCLRLPLVNVDANLFA